MQEDDSSQQREKMKHREEKEQSTISLLILHSNSPQLVKAHEQQTQLRIGREIREIKSAVSENRHFFDVHEEGSVRIQDFSRFLSKYRPNTLFLYHPREGNKR